MDKTTNQGRHSRVAGTVAGKRFGFGRARRLHGRVVFGEVYRLAIRRSVGPLTFCVAVNGLGYPRLGLSVSRRVGTAVRRQRVKRLVREAFRLSQHDWPRGYDVIVIVREHEPVGLADYQRMLFQAMRWTHKRWEKREGGG